MVLFLFAGAFLALVIFVALFVRVGVDQEPRGPMIQNDTGEYVAVWTVDPDGTEHLRIGYRPGDSFELPGECGSELVARDEAGNFIARRGPFEPSPSDGCHDPTWVITN
jgi:hypothetical protein